MSRYRAVRTNLWNDRDFNRLSHQAKIVYIYLMTGPNSTNILGLSDTPINRVSSDLGIGIDTKDQTPGLVSIGLNDIFKEIEKSGMLIREESTDAIILPKEIILNQIDSWKQLKGLFSTLDEIPEGNIKKQAIEIIKLICAEKQKTGVSDEFLEQFNKGIDRVNRNSGLVSIPDQIRSDQISNRSDQIRSDINQKKITNDGLNEQVVQEPASQSLVVRIHDSSISEKKQNAKEEEKIYAIRKAYEGMYRNRLGIDDNDNDMKKKMPPWGAKERTMAKKLIKEKGVETTIELMDYYFKWQNKQVIASGYPFASGWAAFGVKINELCADIADHGSRKLSNVVDLNAKQRHIEERQKLEAEYLSRQVNLDNSSEF